MRLVFGVSGASGTALAERVLAALADGKHEVHLVLTRGAEETRALELPEARFPATHRHPDDAWTAPPASSSFVATCDAVLVVPTSMKTVASLAHGFTDSVLLRAADAALRLRRPLVLAPRETPLGEVALENLLRLSRMGATIVPPVAGWYTRPRTLADMEAFLAGKILDAARVPHDLYPRWGSDP